MPNGTLNRRTGQACAAVGALLTVLVTVEWSPLLAADRALAEGLHRHAVAHPLPTRIARVLTDWFWDPWTMRLLGLLLAARLWWRGARGRALVVVGALVVAMAAQGGLKALVGRERPVWPDPVDSARLAAYPSGHAMTAIVACALLLWAAGRVPGPAALALAAVSVAGAGVTRLYLGVHWGSDVLGGWLLGAALASCALALCARFPGEREPGPPRAPRPS